MLLLSRNMCQCDIYIERESVQVGFCWGSCWVASDRSSTIDMKSLLCVILLLRQLTIRNEVWFSWMVAENSRMTLVNIKYHIFFTNTGGFFSLRIKPLKMICVRQIRCQREGRAREGSWCRCCIDTAENKYSNHFKNSQSMRIKKSYIFSWHKYTVCYKHNVITVC